MKPDSIEVDSWEYRDQFCTADMYRPVPQTDGLEMWEKLLTADDMAWLASYSIDPLE